MTKQQDTGKARVGAGNPFDVTVLELDDGALYARLRDYLRALHVLWTYDGTLGSVTPDLAEATHTLYEEAARREIPLHRLPRYPWEQIAPPPGADGSEGRQPAGPQAS